MVLAYLLAVRRVWQECLSESLSWMRRVWERLEQMELVVHWGRQAWNATMHGRQEGVAAQHCEDQLATERNSWVKLDLAGWSLCIATVNPKMMLAGKRDLQQVLYPVSLPFVSKDPKDTQLPVSNG